MQAGAGPRDATRGGVNRAALPRERGRERPLRINQWGSDYRVLRGKKIGDGTIELIPGS